MDAEEKDGKGARDDNETGEDPPFISYVIPLYNEADSIPELAEWIRKVMEREGFSYEVLFVDDGSNDGSWQRIEEAADKDPCIRAIRFRRNNGKSAGLNTGFLLARGRNVVTMDADLQDSPEEVPALIQMIEEEGYDLVSGWKTQRNDPKTKTLPTKLFNWATRQMSGVKLHDFNCGLKAYRGEVARNIEVYGEMHRYIPVIAKREGFFRIGEKPVEHFARRYGSTKFGIERFINGFLDLATITFVGRFSKKPMHFFGSLGTFMFVVGFLGAFYLGSMKMYYLSHGMDARLVTDRPTFYIALTTMILGTQLFLTGFLAEMISRNSSERNSYKVEKALRYQGIEGKSIG
ncbi:MAG: glycosyltransferase family 2 protein [Flavobacteriales bacterium]